jgi:hypothetical protein
MTINIIGTQHFRNMQCRVLFIVMLSVIMPSVVMLFVMAPCKRLIVNKIRKFQLFLKCIFNIFCFCRQRQLVFQEAVITEEEIPEQNQTRLPRIFWAFPGLPGVSVIKSFLLGCECS